MKFACCLCNAKLDTGAPSGERLRCSTCKVLVLVPPSGGAIAQAPDDAAIYRGASTRGALENAWLQLLKKYPPAEAPKAFRQSLEAYLRLRPPAPPKWTWTGLGPLDAPEEKRCLVCPAAGDLGLAPCPLCGTNPFDGPDGARRLDLLDRARRERPPLDSQHLREVWAKVGEARMTGLRSDRAKCLKTLEALLGDVVDAPRTAPLRSYANLALALALFSKGYDAADAARIRSLLYGSFVGAIRRDPIRLALGAFCVIHGEWGEALHHLSALPATGPLALSSRFLLAVAEIENGMASNALARLPDGDALPIAAILRARALLRLDRGVDAAPILQGLAERHPSNGALRCLLAAAEPARADDHLAAAERSPLPDVKSRARILRAWRRPGAADIGPVSDINRPWLARAFFLGGDEPRALATLGTGDAHLEWRAHFALAKGRINDALPLYERLSKERPWNPELQAVLGFARAKAGKLAEAFPLIEAAAKAGAGDPRMTYFQALVHVKQGHPLKAIPLLRELHAQRPDDAALALNLATLLYGQAAVQFQRARVEDAAETWSESAALGFEPDLVKSHVAEARFRSGVRRLMSRREVDADTLESLQHAADSAAEPAYAYYFGLALLKAGRFEDARARFASAKTSDRFRDRAALHESLVSGSDGTGPGPRAEAQSAWLRALPHFREGRWQEAIDAIDAMLQRGVPETLFPASLRQLPALRVRCLYKLKGAEALERSLATVSNDDGSADYIRGILSASRDKPAEAMDHFRRAAPKNAGARDALLLLLSSEAASFLAAGQALQAAKTLEQAVKDFPDDPDVHRWYNAVRYEAVPRSLLASPRALDAFSSWEGALGPLIKTIRNLEEKPTPSTARALDDARRLRQVIMHNAALAAHRKAIDFEESRDFSSADRCWTRALNYWLTLIRGGELEKMLVAGCQRQFDEADPAAAREVVGEFVSDVLLGACIQFQRHYENAGRSQRASLHLRFAEPIVRFMLERNPDDPGLRRNLAGLKFEQAVVAGKSKQFEEALALLVGAIELDPTIEVFYLVGAMILAEYAAATANKGDLSMAAGLATLAVALNPHDENVGGLAEQLETACPEPGQRRDRSHEDRASWIEDQRREIRSYCIRDDTMQDDAIRAILDCLTRGMSDGEILALLADHSALENVPPETLEALLKQVRQKYEEGNK